MAEAALDVPLRPYVSLNKSFTKLHVEREGRSAALGNNKSVLVYHFKQKQDEEHPEQRDNVYRYKDETKRLFAIRFNPHYNRRMHLASAKGQLVHVWHLEDKAASATSTRGVTTLRQQTPANVLDICWSRFEENLLAAGDFLWDTRTQDPVQEWKVPGGGSRVLTTQVTFNRKNPYLLASAKDNQVYIWDSRWGQKPIDTIPVSLPTDPVTSLDWSSQSEYDLLTSGGENFSLWRVDSAKAKQVASRGSSSSNSKGASVLVKKRTWHQPVKKVLFAPFGQAAITVARGFFEGKQELQTIKMWSIPSQDLQLISTLKAGIFPIVGVSWRSTGDGYQVASLDGADHLRLHDVEKLNFSSPGVHLPAGDSSGAREHSSTTESETLETATTAKTPALRNEILPVVWSLSELQSGSASRTTTEMTSDNPFRELLQVEHIAKRGGFGSVPVVHLRAAQKLLEIVMAANCRATTLVAQQLGSRDRREREIGEFSPRTPHSPRPGGPQILAHCRLRVTAKVQMGHRSRDTHVAIQVATEKDPTPSADLDSSTVLCEDLLDEVTVKRLQATAEEVMRQPPKLGKSRVEACLIQLRSDLDECVRKAANKAAGVFSREELFAQQVGPQYDIVEQPEGGVQQVVAKSALASSLPDEEDIPCPRRFGATFAANGSLVVFSSSSTVVRAGRKREERNGQQVFTYPRTYGCFKKCLEAGRQLHNDEESQGDGVHRAHSSLVASNHTWFRSPWGYGPDEGLHDEDDGVYDLDRSSTEETFVEEDKDALDSNDIADSTRLPISHPDHSLGAGLGGTSETDGEEVDPADAADNDVEGGLPWKPKFNKIFWVDCTGLLPGSPIFAAFFKMGPVRHPPTRSKGNSNASLTVSGEKKRRQERSERHFGLVMPEMNDIDGAVSDTPVSLSTRSRRSLPVYNQIASSGMPPPISVSQRGWFSALESSGRTSGAVRRTSIDGGQMMPPILARRWESSPDFKALLGKSSGSGSRGGWVTPSGSGRNMIAGPPFFAGSPGRSELIWGVRFSATSGSVDDNRAGSPQHPTQTSDLEDVAEVPFDGSGVKVTPPRSMGGPMGDAGTLSPGATPGMKSSGHSYHWTRHRRLVKRRQHQGSSNGPSTTFDTPRLRPGMVTPASPADPSTSPLMSDFGMDLGQISAPPGLSNASTAGQGTVSRSSSFSTSSGGGVGETAAERNLVGHSVKIGRHIAPGKQKTAALSQRSSFASYGLAAVTRDGAGVHSGEDIGVTPCERTSIEEGSEDDPPRTVAQVCRHNSRVAAAKKCGELASVWALLSEATGRAAPVRRNQLGQQKQSDSRCFPRWKVSSARLTSKILAHHEACADPQMLASIASVVGPDGLDGGSAGWVSQGVDQVPSFDRYMDCYGGRCLLWGADDTRAETISHQTNASFRCHEVETPTNVSHVKTKLRCSVCDGLVHGRLLLCQRCGHGGHLKHMMSWFELEKACRHETCECLCRDTVWQEFTEISLMN